MNLRASDIITRASQIADLENSDFISYYENINLLNEQWASLYTQICNTTDDYFIRSVTVSTGDYLPEDFYQMASLKDERGNLLLRRTKSNNDKISFSYELQNNQIILPVSMKSAIMEYFPIPQFLSFPSKDIVLDDDYHSVFDGQDSLVSYILSGSLAKQIKDLETNTVLESLDSDVNECYLGKRMAIIKKSSDWYRFTLPDGTQLTLGNYFFAPVKKDGELYYATYSGTTTKTLTIKSAYDYNKVSITVRNITVNPTEYLCTFDDNYFYYQNSNSIKVYDFDGNLVENISSQTFNIQVIDGCFYYRNAFSNLMKRYPDGYEEIIDENTNAICILKIDKTTGYGIVSKNNITGEYKIISSLPDTELNFPSNLFYTVLAYKLAIRYKIKQNADITLTSYELQEAEKQFYDSISRDNNQSYRIQNVYGIGNILY